jgi:hypothetical protein
MAISQLRRIFADAILAAVVLVLSTGLGIAAAAAKCPRSTPSATSQVAPPGAARQQPPAVERIAAGALPIWKTITIGTYKGVDAVRAAVDAAPCPIALGDWADEILGRPGFPFSRKSTELDLVVVSVADLGFGDQGAPLRDIHARALASGLELCPAEVGPVLRLNYLDQPAGEFLHLAMRPVARYSGELVDFTLGNGGSDLILIGGDARPEMILPGVVRLVFVRPRPDAIGIASPATDASLAKR